MTAAFGVIIHAVSGEWAGTPGPVESLADVQLAWLDFAAGARVSLPVAATRTIFFYTVAGQLRHHADATAPRPAQAATSKPPYCLCTQPPGIA